MSTLVLLDSFWEGLATPGAELGVEGFHAEKWTAAVAKLYPKSLTSYLNGLPTKLPRKRRRLLEKWGFKCSCSRCQSKDDVRLSDPFGRIQGLD